MYNSAMGGLTQPPLSNRQQETNWRPILVGMALVLVVVGIIAVLSREKPKPATAPHPYANKLKISDLKMSAAENFVGASVTYIDGMVTNTGDKIVTHATIHLEFKNSMGQVAQVEDVPVRVLQTSGPYPDAVDLNLAPLTPGQSKPFRIILEHVSADWNREYPAMQVTDVKLQSV
jgi:hypothetical protein